LPSSPTNERIPTGPR